MTLLTAADKRTLDLSGQIASDTILITNGLQIWLAHLICLELHTGKWTNGRRRPGNCQCNGLSRGSVKRVINHQMLWERSTYKLDSFLSGGCKWIRSEMATRSRAFSLGKLPSRGEHSFEPLYLCTRRNECTNPNGEYTDTANGSLDYHQLLRVGNMAMPMYGPIMGALIDNCRHSIFGRL